MPLDLTIAIPVKNEERHLSGCLDSIGHDLASRIVVIDSSSTDGTKSIAKARGVQVLDFAWNGKFPKKRNWYLQNHTPETKWVLFLDADEYLTEPFKKELRQVLTAGDEEVTGYWLNYSIYFMGSMLKGGYPLNKLALFKVGSGEYERINEDHWSKLDMEIHEHPILNGKIGKMKSKIDHQNFNGISYDVIKHNEYAEWEAERFSRAMADPDVKKSWTWKQKLKYRLMDTVLIGPVYFFGCFVLLGGFRDGARGLAFAILKTAYFNQVYCKIREQKTN